MLWIVIQELLPLTHSEKRIRKHSHVHHASRPITHWKLEFEEYVLHQHYP